MKMFIGMLVTVLGIVVIFCGVMILMEKEVEVDCKYSDFQYIEFNGFTVTVCLPKDNNKDDIVICLMKDGKGIGTTYNSELIMIAASEIGQLRSAKEEEEKQ
jgi:hypothetical protein